MHDCLIFLDAFKLHADLDIRHAAIKLLVIWPALVEQGAVIEPVLVPKRGDSEQEGEALGQDGEQRLLHAPLVLEHLSVVLVASPQERGDVLGGECAAAVPCGELLQVQRRDIDLVLVADGVAELEVL